MPRSNLVAINIDLPADTPIESEGIAYYRIAPDLRDFIEKCWKDHEVIGFEYDGSLNLGIILRKKTTNEQKTQK